MYIKCLKQNSKAAPFVCIDSSLTLLPFRNLYDGVTADST
jgi:hypothetical protein